MRWDASHRKLTAGFWHVGSAGASSNANLPLCSLACSLLLFLSSSRSARPRLNRTLRRRSIRTVVNQRRETSRLFPSTSPPIATFARSTFRGLEDRRLRFDHQTLLYLVNLQWIPCPFMILSVRALLPRSSRAQRRKRETRKRIHHSN